MTTSEQTATREELLDRATALLPALAERAAETEELRQVPPATVSDLRDSGLMRVAPPARYGGHGTDIDPREYDARRRVRSPAPGLTRCPAVAAPDEVRPPPSRPAPCARTGRNRRASARRSRPCRQWAPHGARTRGCLG